MNVENLLRLADQLRLEIINSAQAEDIDLAAEGATVRTVQRVALLAKLEVAEEIIRVVAAKAPDA